MKLFSDMTIPGMRYIKNNGEHSFSECILSGDHPLAEPFKCHLWSVRLFVEEHKTFSLFFSKVVESILILLNDDKSL